MRGWYRQAKADRGEGAPGELTTAEREELKRLRRGGSWISRRPERRRRICVDRRRGHRRVVFHGMGHPRRWPTRRFHTRLVMRIPVLTRPNAGPAAKQS
ncbi:hypothetical protein [Streptomyces hirsutus]|uniref:hypothetical protein n=1 Tax=Streptomyces hirsutus TaxID=35620 RepID=UPI00364A6532